MSEKVKRMAGKTIPFVMIMGLICLLAGMIFNVGVSEEKQLVRADTATTTVTIGNKAPDWVQDAEEAAESSVANPTNAGNDVSWNAIANDVNGDDYYLLICSTSSVPTANDGAAPDCAGGSANQWAVSTNTATGTTSTATYTTQPTDPEANNWYAFICDGNVSGARCNATYKTGTGNTASPFVVNHRPDFDALSNNSPQDPAGTITWSTNANTSDPDSYGGQDTVILHVCQTSGWNTSTAQCLGAFWCSSTAVVSNPSCGYNLGSVEQDRTHQAFAFLVDEHGFAHGVQASSSDYDVGNVAPTITAASINLLDTDGSGNLQLLPAYAATATPGFSLEATISDDNSCEAYGGASEINVTSSIAFIYRSGIGAGSCDSAGEADPNNCYVIVGTCQLGPCGGSGDSDVTTTCSFSLWFVAEPTFGAATSQTPWWEEEWLASVKAVDNNFASSTTESSNGNELQSMLAYDLLTDTIDYGTVSPAEFSDQSTSTVQATGNVGMDENLSGVDMDKVGGGEIIPIGKQHYATTSGFDYWLEGATTTGIATELELNCPKSTSTSTPATKDTYWMILIPNAISTGVFNGTNTIAAVTSEGTDW